MSSSRSIAAARNRRAGEQQPQPQINRPGTSISSQPAFSQQNKRSVTAPTTNSAPNVQVTNASNAKLSISDAIGLITLRLGRVEQIIMNSEHNGGLNTGTSLPDNTQLVDKSVINSIVNRIDSLEKKEKEPNNQQTTKLENEIRDIKDLLMAQILKYEKFTLETNKRLDDFKQTIIDHQNTFDDFDQAIIEIEKKQELLNCSINTTQIDDDVSNDNENDNENTSTNFSGNLKSVIEQELAISSA